MSYRRVRFGAGSVSNNFWSDETVLKLIEEFKQQRCLWDPKNRDKRKKEKKQESYKELSRKLGVPTEEIKRKIYNVLQSYRIYRRKALIRNNHCRNINNDGVSYTPNWFAFQAIHEFMEDAYTPTDPMESFNDSDIEIFEEETDTVFGAGDETANNDADQSVDIELHDEQFPEIVCDENQRTGQSRSPKTIKKDKKQRRKHVKDPVLSVTLDYLQKELKRDVPRKREKDECDIYGELLAMRLRKMDGITREYVMHEIDNVMFQTFMAKQGQNIAPS